TVFGSALAAIVDAGAVQGAANRVVTDTGKILDAAAANHHDRMLLQVVTFAADVARNLVTVGQPHTGDFPKRGIRLLGGGGVHTGTHAALLRTAGEGRNLALVGGRPPGLSY